MFIDTLITYTFYAVVAYWIFTHGAEFGSAVAALRSGVQSGTRSLWGFS